MKIKKTLQNPFVLVAQGFVAGAILFFSTTPTEVNPSGPPLQQADVARAAETIA